MNNQMPYYGDFNPNLNMNQNPGYGNNYNEVMFERLNNRLNRLERQVRMLENKVNRLEGGNPTFLKSNSQNDDNDNMYML